MGFGYMTSMLERFRFEVLCASSQACEGGDWDALSAVATRTKTLRAGEVSKELLSVPDRCWSDLITTSQGKGISEEKTRSKS